MQNPASVTRRRQIRGPNARRQPTGIDPVLRAFANDVFGMPDEGHFVRHALLPVPRSRTTHEDRWLSLDHCRPEHVSSAVVPSKTASARTTIAPALVPLLLPASAGSALPALCARSRSVPCFRPSKPVPPGDNTSLIEHSNMGYEGNSNGDGHQRRNRFPTDTVHRAAHLGLRPSPSRPGDASIPLPNRIDPCSATGILTERRNSPCEGKGQDPSNGRA